MRLIGLALLAGWLVSWSAAPHGGPARSTSIVGAVACAVGGGGERVAAAWIEVRRGVPHDVLHVVVLGPGERPGDRFELATQPDAIGFRLVDAGGDAFVLAAEHRDPQHHYFELHRITPGRHTVLPRLVGSPDGQSWQLAAAAGEIVLVEELTSGSLVHTYVGDGWSDDRTAGRTLVGAGGGHVVRYDESGRDTTLTIAPEQTSASLLHLSRPFCLDALPLGDARPAPAVTSVVGLRGGYARLVRRKGDACVEGIRDGQAFVYKHVPVAGFVQPRLVAPMTPDGRLSVIEDQALLTQRRVVLASEPGGETTVQATAIHPQLAGDVTVRYRVFGGADQSGLVDLATRVTHDEIQVVLERQGTGAAHVLAPSVKLEPDYRPLMRQLAVVPLGCLLLAVAAALGLLRRVRALRPTSGDEPLAAGRATVEGTLVVDADAPRGGLRLRSGRSLVTLFVEVAQVLRASDMRPRSQPRGDAIDVAAGAQVVASGRVEPGTLYRDDATLRAGAGDLIIVGCSLAEARARTMSRLYASLALFAGALALVLAVATR